MKKFLMALLLIAACTAGASARNGQPAGRKLYTDKEGWNLQLLAGPQLTFAENTSAIPLWQCMNGNAVARLGKKFTPWLGVRVQFMYGNDYGFFEPDNPKTSRYSFNHLGSYLLFDLNLTNMFRRATCDEWYGWNLSLLIGPGCRNSFDFDLHHYNGGAPLPATITQTASSFFGGLEFSVHLTPYMDLSMEVSGNIQTDNYNGMESGVLFQGNAHALLGLRFTIW